MKLMVLLASLGLASALLFVSADGADAASSLHHAAHARVYAQHHARTPGATPRAVAAIMGK